MATARGMNKGFMNLDRCISDVFKDRVVLMLELIKIQMIYEADKKKAHPKHCGELGRLKSGSHRPWCVASLRGCALGRLCLGGGAQ